MNNLERYTLYGMHFIVLNVERFADESCELRSTDSREGHDWNVVRRLSDDVHALSQGHQLVFEDCSFQCGTAYQSHVLKVVVTTRILL